MRKFTDSKGDEWTIDVNFQFAYELKLQAGCDILDIAEGKDLVKLSEDMIVLGAAFWILVEDQAKERKLEEKDFFRRLDGDSLERATVVLIAECFDFFPAKKRQLLRTTYEKIVGMQNRGVDRATELLSQMSDADLAKLATGSNEFLKPPDDSASSPGDSPPVN